MRTRARVARVSAFLMMGWFFLVNAADVARAELVNDDLSARVKGTQAGNWEIGLGDQVGVPGGFVQADGEYPLWIGTVTYDFALNYHAITGLADFQVWSGNYTSTKLISPDYGLAGQGFSSLELGLKDKDDPAHPTSLSVFDLVLNGASLGSAPYDATATYTNHSLYSGTVLADIALTGSFILDGNYVGNNEGTKFDLYLQNAAVVPEPVSSALMLLGAGALTATGLRGRKNFAGFSRRRHTTAISRC